MVDGSDFTATSELGAHRPSGSTPDCHYVNLSDTASGNIKAWLQGTSLRCVKGLRQRNSLAALKSQTASSCHRFACRRDLPCNSSALVDVAHGSDSLATVKGSADATPSQPPLQQPFSGTATVQATPPSDHTTALESRLQACTATLETAKRTLEVSQLLADHVQASLHAYTNLDLSLKEHVTVAGLERQLETIRQLRSQQPSHHRSVSNSEKRQRCTHTPAGVSGQDSCAPGYYSLAVLLTVVLPCPVCPRVCRRDFAPGTSLTSADTVTANTVATIAGSSNGPTANATTPMLSANQQPNGTCSHGAPPVQQHRWHVVVPNGAVVLPISAGAASIAFIAIAAAVIRQLRHTWASRKVCAC